MTNITKFQAILPEGAKQPQNIFLKLLIIDAFLSIALILVWFLLNIVLLSHTTTFLISNCY